ncbi:uncharacterized protein LOC130052643 [Ostrea edulis]|uniref:uncharacterized protein LOC130052643 n=1 Tax=Ostrea edulis TaxID=37623 RepID=UPI0024AEDE17|nr:uncharacterized protein LOC130052643 [Ostrea edulis]XP_056014181.1 uncharacterized protein LOC130052643 [Ostrea edulis]
MKLFFLTVTIFCLCELFPQSEAVSSHCGYHALNHYYTTRCNSTYCTKYYKVKYGYCSSSGYLQYEVNVYYNGRQLYYYITYYRNGKRALDAGKEALEKIKIARRSTNEKKSVKTVQAEEYGTILQKLGGKVVRSGAKSLKGLTTDIDQ